MIALLVIVVLLIGLSVTLYPDLRSWRRRRRVAWELERAEWREWISQP